MFAPVYFRYFDLSSDCCGRVCCQWNMQSMEQNALWKIFLTHLQQTVSFPLQ